MAKQITFYKIGTIITSEGSLEKRYDSSVFESRQAAEDKVMRLLDGHRETFKAYPKAFDGWSIDYEHGKVIAPDSVKRYIISEFTQVLHS